MVTIEDPSISLLIEILMTSYIRAKFRKVTKKRNLTHDMILECNLELFS